MSGSAEKEHADRKQYTERMKQEAARLRAKMAESASLMAIVEEKVANTLEEIAKHRPAADAEHLRRLAQDARKHAERNAS